MNREDGLVSYGSICSGIEAATVAMHQEGWEAEWFAEIEASPSAVLAHHYPDVPNLGDMTKIAAMVRDGLVAAPDVLVGGTPCQAFSIAGLRAGLEDARGQLTLSFVELADEIDAARTIRGLPPCTVWWENVPGVLSSSDNAFGCFLGALAGEDCALVPPGGKWANAGCVFGPKRAIAWRVLDAQYFGVAQRRRRVFVVASAREDFNPTEILFEFDGVRRDTAPSREAREDVAGTVRASAARRGGVQGECGLGLQPVTCMAHGQGGAEISVDRAPTLTCNHEAPIAAYSVALRGRDGGATAELGDEVAGCLRASSGGGDKPHVLAPYIAAPVTRSVERPRGDGLDTLIAFDCKSSGQSGFGVGEIASTLRSINSAKSHANGGGHLAVAYAPAIAFDSRQDTVSSTDVFGAPGSSSPQAQAVCVTGEVTRTLKAEGFDASEDGTSRGQPIVYAVREVAQCLTGNYGKQADNSDTSLGPNVAIHGMEVRRLLPVECERLQDFPDGYTRIPVKKAKKRSKLYEYEVIDGQLWQMSADGPRYKALGNSMCVKNMRWIGKRIDAALRRSSMRDAA
jgi:DNA (cytosine-5)-methyltransferase 1